MGLSASKGSLEEGKTADMVILSANPYEMSPADLKTLRVEKLMLQGRDYGSAMEGAFGAILRGLTNGSKSY